MLQHKAVDAESSNAYTVTDATFWCNCCMQPEFLGSPTLSEPISRPGSLSERTVATAREVLAGKRRGFGAALAFAGLDVGRKVAGVHIGDRGDDGGAGAKYGYGLL